MNEKEKELKLSIIDHIKSVTKVNYIFDEFSFDLGNKIRGRCDLFLDTSLGRIIVEVKTENDIYKYDQLEKYSNITNLIIFLCIKDSKAHKNFLKNPFKCLLFLSDGKKLVKTPKIKIDLKFKELSLNLLPSPILKIVIGIFELLITYYYFIKSTIFYNKEVGGKNMGSWKSYYKIFSKDCSIINKEIKYEVNKILKRHKSTYGNIKDIENFFIKNKITYKMNIPQVYACVYKKNKLFITMNSLINYKIEYTDIKTKKYIVKDNLDMETLKRLIKKFIK